MAPVLPDEKRGMTDHPLIVDLLVSDLMSDASVKALCTGIGIFSDRGVLPKRLGKPFRTLAIDHARCIRSLRAARSMHHKLFDQLKQVIIMRGNSEDIRLSMSSGVFNLA